MLTSNEDLKFAIPRDNNPKRGYAVFGKTQMLNDNNRYHDEADQLSSSFTGTTVKEIFEVECGQGIKVISEHNHESFIDEINSIVLEEDRPM